MAARTAAAIAATAGQTAERVLEQAGITTNKNPIPFDIRSPAKWSGLRLGTAAVTTRGFQEAEMEQLGEVISSLLRVPDATEKARQVVARLCRAPGSSESGPACSSSS